MTSKFKSNALRIVTLSVLGSFGAAAKLVSLHASTDFNERYDRQITQYTAQYTEDLNAKRIFEDTVKINRVSNDTLQTSIGPIICPLWESWEANSRLIYGDSTGIITVRKAGNSYQKVITPSELIEAHQLNHHAISFSPYFKVADTKATLPQSTGSVIPFRRALEF